MDKEKILRKLNKDIPLFLYDTVSSTNTLAKEEIKKGILPFSTFIAKCQTDGRGRHGKSFYSPVGTGVYLSTVLKPSFGAADGWRITVSAAVAAVRAINSVFSVTAGIKWVNDIYINGKKAAGILCEAVGHDMEYAVVGIGINVAKPKEGYPCDIPLFGTVTDTATDDEMCLLISSFLNEFFSLYETDCLEEYRKNCFIIGKTVYADNVPYTVLGINEHGNLKVKNNLTGEEKALMSGEISIKMGCPNSADRKT